MNRDFTKIKSISICCQSAANCFRFSSRAKISRLKKVGYNGTLPVLGMSSHKGNNTILSAKWKRGEAVTFFDASFTITDYGACSVVYPYLDFENPKTKNMETRNYDGQTLDDEAIAIFNNGPTPASFIVYFKSFQQNINTIFTTNKREKMSIQYTVPGFEPITFGT